MVGIALQLVTTDWVPNAQGYGGHFDFESCPKPGLVQTFSNNTSQLQSFDHSARHTVPLPTALDAWPFTTGFQFFGVLLYHDGTSVTSTSRTINLVWNGKQVAAQTWSAVPGNQCVYFEFQVDNPGASVPSGDDPCNPPVGTVSFAGIDALRTDYEMLVTRAFLVGEQRPEPEPPAPGEPAPTPSPPEETSEPPRICTRDSPVETIRLPPSHTDSSTPITTSTSATTSASTLISTTSNPTESLDGSSYLPSASSTSSIHSATNTSGRSSDPNEAQLAVRSGLHPGAMGGIAVGSVAAVLTLLLAMVFIRRRTRRRKQEKLFLAPYDTETGGSPTPLPKERFEAKIVQPTERSADTGVEETGFRDFYSAMRRAGLTVQSLLEHHSGPRDRAPDGLPGYTAA